tara:strand:+ start:192 stop:518 length:327 start_codon:yes stop_codon:yes gene_type:complete
MIKRLFFVCAASLIVGCTFEVHREPSPHAPVTYVEGGGSSYIEAYYFDDLTCYEDPYWYSAEWCESYGDGSMCCVWWVSYYEDYYWDGWYEEWCQWDVDYCWEYNGTF